MRPRFILCPAFLFGLALLPATPLAAVTVTLQQANLPTAAYTGSIDAFVTTGPSNNQTGSNYGAAGALAVSAPGSAKGEFQSLLQFDLSTAKSALDAALGAGLWTLQSVQLQMTAQSPSNVIFNTVAAGNITVNWLKNDSWTEGAGTPNVPTTTGVTYNSLSGLLTPGQDQALGTFSFSGATSGNVLYTLAAASGLTNDLATGGIATFDLVGSSGVSGVFNSANFTTAANHPALIINAVAAPEPSRAVLLVLSAGLCITRRRRIA